MNLDPYRLPRAVLARHYAVTLEPELAEATFSGSVSIAVDATEPVDQIVLNAIELDITSVEVNGAAAGFTLDESTERLFIDAPLAPGPARLDIVFSGVLNDKLRGFYRSTYTDDDGTNTSSRARRCRPPTADARSPASTSPTSRPSSVSLSSSTTD